MSIPAAGSIPFAYALQNKGAGLGLTYKSNTANYATMYAPDDDDYNVLPAIYANFAPAEAIDQFEREVDTSYHTTGLYKRYYAGGGRVTLYPRLESKIGELLFAAVGGVATQSYNSDATHAKATIFKPVDDLLKFPWLSVRRYIHGATAEDREGEELRDTRVTSAVFQVGAGSPMVMSLGLLGITPIWSTLFSNFGTSMEANEEAIGSVPVAMEGIGPILTEIAGMGDLGVESGVEQPVIGAQIAIANTFSGSRPDDELLIGSYSPDDMVLTAQDVNVSFTVKWRNPKLYRALMRGSTTGFSWTPRVTRSELNFYLGSQDFITGTEIPYRMHFYGKEVAWSMTPIELRAGGFLMTQLTGMIQKQSKPSDAFSLVLENGVEYTGTTYTGTW